ncbi:MFS general substrate transporter [Mycena rosella]|uniref:MFS general substrate transporter n=1 Tax=Mycena rosella TaxID=1033263 RepID=A0AAD7CUU1_MYCRO|nr:MFS general substrate transporter [Mycena rosella]
MPEETSGLLAEHPNEAVYGTVARDTEADTDSHKPQVSLPTILVPMAIGIFLCALDQTIVVSSYAAIGSELNQLQNTSWIATAYMLTLTSFQPLYGKMRQAGEYDIFGRKPCLLFAYFVFALGGLACGLAKTMPQLILARGLAGIGGGGMSTIASIIMSDIVPLRSRGTWQGIMNIIYASGSATGAPLGGFLSDSIGWRWGFLIQIPAIVLAFISVSFALHLPQTDTSDFKTKLKRVDFSGALSLVLCVFFLLFGLDRGGNLAWNDKYTISALCAFGVFFILFASIELAWATEPFAPRRIIANRSLIGAYMVNLFALASSFSMLFHTALFFQAVLGKSPSEVGFWLVPTVFGGVSGSLAGGLIIQATGKYYWLTFYAYVAMAVGMLGTVLEAGVLTKSAIGVACASFVSAIGNGTGVTTSLIALISNAGPADQAMATAVSYLFRSLGSVVGLSIGSTLLQVSLRALLRAKLTGADVDIEEIVRRVRESLKYIDELDPATAGVVRSAYERAVLVTMWFSTAMAVCALISASFIREKPLTRR